ncbi:MAG: ribosome biogenesis GTPase Der [Myxococcaceae bacterium]
MKPIVAIVGRPNVGKSTLFNRLIGQRRALVQDLPGVTRDRHYGELAWNGRAVTLVDTGGFTTDEKDPLLAQVRAQTQVAIDEADAILWVTDGRAGMTGVDEDLARLLRKSGRPLAVVVNKTDNEANSEVYQSEFSHLGFPNVFAVSAEHARGLGDVLSFLEATLPGSLLSEEPPEAADGAVRVAIIGRPNAGKSTLINALLKTQRLVVSDVAGTTRDAIDSTLIWNDTRFVLTDTAGIRRKHGTSAHLEHISVLTALRAVERSDLAVLLMDAQELAVEQDAKLAGWVADQGKALIVLVNKWDLAATRSLREGEVRKTLAHALKFVSYAPIVFASAKESDNLGTLLKTAKRVHEQFGFRAQTGQLNRLLQRIVDAHPAPRVNGRPLRLYYIRQVARHPPTFALTCNSPGQVPQHYRRYLVQRLRETFELEVPLHLVFKARPGEAKRASRNRPQLHKKTAQRRRRSR